MWNTQNISVIITLKGFGDFPKVNFKMGEFCSDIITPEEAAVRFKKTDCNIFHSVIKGNNIGKLLYFNQYMYSFDPSFVDFIDP